MFSRKKDYFYLYCLSYILGLLLTGLFSINQILGLVIIIVIIYLSLGLILRWQQIYRVKVIHLIISFTVTFASFFYYYWRFPTVDNNNISHEISSLNYDNSSIIIQGLVTTSPRMNQNNRGQFIIKADGIIKDNYGVKPVTGKVYVTSPLISTVGIYPSVRVNLQGRLYKPQSSFIPDGFDFANYLERQGIFAGFSAESVTTIREGNLWQKQLSLLRERITQTHVRYLDVPQGNLLSSMVIGSRAVDLDRELQGEFRRAGLAHIIAASGFHVSLLLGVVLFLTKSLSPSMRFMIGGFSLFLYATLTGFYPSILRACLMGIAVLVGIINEKSVKISATLLLAALILLLINPLWIWDLGFQLSFLATWGLIVSLPAIVNYLDGIPPTLANIMAVPISATIWTLPLLWYVFHRIPLYGILTNILTTPLVIILTLGGMVTGFIGIFFPIIGSSLSLVLLPFIWLIIKLVEISNSLPFSSLAVGKINVIMVIFSYIILFAITYILPLKKYRLWLILFTLSLVIIPLAYQKLTLVQVTIMDTGQNYTIIIQNKNSAIALNLGDKNNVNFNVIPFLKSQGVNEISLWEDYGESSSSVNVLNREVKVKYFDFKTSEKYNLLSMIDAENKIIQADFEGENWLIIKGNLAKKSLQNQISPIKAVFISQKNINDSEIQQINPSYLLRRYPPENDKKNNKFSENNTEVILTRNKIIQWQPHQHLRILNQN